MTGVRRKKTRKKFSPKKREDEAHTGSLPQKGKKEKAERRGADDHVKLVRQKRKKPRTPSGNSGCKQMGLTLKKGEKEGGLLCVTWGLLLVGGSQRFRERRAESFGEKTSRGRFAELAPSQRGPLPSRQPQKKKENKREKPWRRSPSLEKKIPSQKRDSFESTGTLEGVPTGKNSGGCGSASRWVCYQKRRNLTSSRSRTLEGLKNCRKRVPGLA